MKIIDVRTLENKDYNLNDSTVDDHHYVFTHIDNQFNLFFNINKNIVVSILLDNNDSNIYLNGSINDNAYLTIYVADFSKGNINLKSNIDLVGSESRYEWHLASLASSNNKKKFDVSANQLALNTNVILDNYGVCKENAKLEFSGVCHIHNGARTAVAHQNAKIVVFDDNCDAIARPILKIDENDVEASHAATVGKINDDQLFYLLSRGLTESVAKQLITYGYLKPICRGFNNELSNHILNLIEGEI